MDQGELRSDIQFVRDKVIAHDTILKQWFGNGQPGDMDKMLKDLEDLKNLKWKLIGAGAAFIFIMELLHVGAEKALSSLIH